MSNNDLDRQAEGDDELEGTRRRVLTVKGAKYELERLKLIFDDLLKTSETIRTFISDEVSEEVLRTKHQSWMSKYEIYLEKHQQIAPRLPDEDDIRDNYIREFEDRDRYIGSFRETLDQYVRSGKANKNTPSIRTHSSRQSARSVALSNISSKRLDEETKRAELQAKRESLQKKKSLEIAKLKLKMEEEDLQLETGIAVSDAKQRVLDRYEQQLEATASSASGRFRSSRQPWIETWGDDKLENSIIRKTDTENQHMYMDNAKPIKSVTLNPRARAFEPTVTINNERTDKIKISETGINSDRKFYERTENDIEPYSFNAVPRSSVEQYRNHASNETEAVSAIVKSLHRPTPDIKKFSGDPMEFRKFMRQFSTKIVANCDTDDEKMTYLEQFTYGEAGKVVQSYSHLDSRYAFQTAMKQLEDRYGDVEVIANSFIKRALSWPNVKAGDSKGLDQFALFLVECLNAANSISAMNILEYSENIKQLMCKLPYHLHDRWRSIVLHKRSNKQPVKFENFVRFVENEAKKVNDPTFGSDSIGSRKRVDTNNNISANKPTSQSRGVKQGSFATDLNTKSDKSVEECSYCKGSHKLENCKTISKLSHQEKLAHLKSQGLCFGCLKKGHMTKKCTNRLTCAVCKKRHPTILHYESKDETRSNSDNPNAEKTSNNVVSQVGAGDFTTSCAMAIVPVKVKLKDKLKTIDTYAFFDTGSSISFCTESLMNQLGGSGKHRQIELTTMGSPITMNTCMLEGLQVCDIDMNNVINLPTVYTKDTMPVSDGHIPSHDDISKWPHLDGIDFPNIDSSIGLMIGNNVPDAYTPFEVATGPSGSPHATKTRLGWIIWNLVRNDIPESYAVVNRAQITAINTIEETDKLQQLVKNSMNFDFPEKLIDDKQENSVEDKKFVQLVSESVKFEDGHYQIGLPFRENMTLPNNASVGRQRLKGLKSKFIRNPQFKDDYVEFMDKLLDKGYMELVPKDDLDRNDGKVWYLPHHGVYHAQKNKIRVT